MPSKASREAARARKEKNEKTERKGEDKKDKNDNYYIDNQFLVFLVFPFWVRMRQPLVFIVFLVFLFTLRSGCQDAGVVFKNWA